MPPAAPTLQFNVVYQPLATPAELAGVDVAVNERYFFGLTTTTLGSSSAYLKAQYEA